MVDFGDDLVWIWEFFGVGPYWWGARGHGPPGPSKSGPDSYTSQQQ